MSICRQEPDPQISPRSQQQAARRVCVQVSKLVYKTDSGLPQDFWRTETQLHWADPRNEQAKYHLQEAKGAAEAAVLHKKAEAWKQYGDAALVQMVVEKLPELAQHMAAPLSKTKNMVFVSNEGHAGSNLTGDVGRMLSQLPATVEGLTGIDMKKLMTKNREADGVKTGDL